MYTDLGSLGPTLRNYTRPLSVPHTTAPYLDVVDVSVASHRKLFAGACRKLKFAAHLPKTPRTISG